MTGTSGPTRGRQRRLDAVQQLQQRVLL